MSLVSMTGFARVPGGEGDWRFAFELRSVNGRGLDIRVRVPAGMEAVDAAIRSRVAAKISRGSVNISLQMSRGPRAVQYRIDTAFLDTLVGVVKAYGALDGFRPPSLGDLLGIRGVVEAVEPEAGEEAQGDVHAAILATFDLALDELVQSRAIEGEQLTGIVLGQVDRIAALAAEAEASPARTTDAIRQRLQEQVAALVQAPGIDAARLHAEAALLATKADIREELDRLKSHVRQARDMIAKGGAIGRKLDFLAQEFNRESNTLCSKSNHVQLTAIGLELKTVVDQLKEQVQNIE